MKTYTIGEHRYKELQVDAGALDDTLRRLTESGQAKRVYLRRDHGRLLTTIQAGSEVAVESAESRANVYVIIFEEPSP